MSAMEIDEEEGEIPDEPLPSIDATNPKLPELEQKVKHQLDFYFGDTNFAKDSYLRSLCDEEGYAPLERVLQFQAMKTIMSHLSTELQLAAVAQASFASTVFELNKLGSLIRRRKPFDSVIEEARAPARSFRNSMACVFVKNLHNSVTEELLWELFLQVGPLRSVSFLPIVEGVTLSGEGKRAFVEFQHERSVLYACKVLGNTCLYDMFIQVEPGGERRLPIDPRGDLFVKNIPDSWSERQMYDLFAEHGDVQAVKKMKTQGYDQGIVFVTMHPKDADEAVYQLDGMQVRDGTARLIVQLSERARAARAADSQAGPERGRAPLSGSRGSYSSGGSTPDHHSSRLATPSPRPGSYGLAPNSSGGSSYDPARSYYSGVSTPAMPSRPQAYPPSPYSPYIAPVPVPSPHSYADPYRPYDSRSYGGR